MSSGSLQLQHLNEIAPGFLRLAAPFRMMAGLVDIGTHMALLRLSSGRYLVVDTVPLTPEQKTEIDKVTDNGSLIDGVLGVHPFHTMYFKAFHAHYPDAKYYGCPRHLKVIPEIPWAGDLNDVNLRQRWLPDIEMRIPAGSEFVDPQPPTTNHFSSVVILHRPSRTIFVDDTICVFEDPDLIMRYAIGINPGKMVFHRSISGVGLYPTDQAPKDFQCWVEKLLNDWDFDNIASAHKGCAIGGAKEKLRATLAATEPQLKELSKTRSANVGSWTDDWRETCECG